MNLRIVPVALAALLTIAAPNASAATTCGLSPLGRVCTARVDLSAARQQATLQSQQQSQWCWAASIATLFAYHGHPVSQSRIVTEAYGAPVNMPAVAGVVMARQLNRQWTDEYGMRFTARINGLYDADAGILGLTNAQIVNTLANDNPLVIGARSHAMVLTAVTYYDTIAGPNVVAGEVFDPWPGNGMRALQWDELVPMHLGGSLRFLAAVDITRTATGGDESGGGASGGGGAVGVVECAGLILLGWLAMRRRARGSARQSVRTGRQSR